MLRLLLIAILCCFSLLSLAQPKTLNAVKTTTPPHIDGNLDDLAWQQAPIATDFIENFPTYGRPASVRSEVRILYDNDAVYIGAYLYDNPSLIHKQITARDGESRQDVDYFSVFFDTYNDQQNGFQFLVTTANVQTDAKLGNMTTVEFGDFGDKTWDAVWQSQVRMKSDGWVVEMRIPYISLRFAKKDVQTWGLQFLRFTRRNNENSYWNPVNPNISGFTNQFGKYVGLKDIQPPLRLSFSPYLSGGVRVDPTSKNDGTQWLGSGGMDVKYGVNESFTLDATLIPDFGQVVSDNIINNLSPYEVRFQENRPFFTEGTELFNKSGLFYSRRIGAIPSRYYDIENFVNADTNYQIIKNPSVTRLYNGIKFSGRTKKKLGIGIFNAVTAPMEASIRNIDSKQDTIIQTEPLANYNIIVLDQALRGRSSVTFTNTNVIRNGEGRDANVSAFDWSLFSDDNKYQFAGTLRYSKIFGYTPYTDQISLINDTITRNEYLFIKPYGGLSASARLGKISGKVQYYAGSNIISNSYDPNDLGYLQTPNLITHSAGASYNQLTPKGKFLTYRFSLDLISKYLYKPYSFSELEVISSAFGVFRNFWDVTFTVSSLPYWQHDYFELRTPGRFVNKPSELNFEIEGSTDSRKRWFVNYLAGYAVRSLANDPYYKTELGVRYRFSNKFILSVDMFRQQEANQVGYAFLRETNNEPIIGYRKFTETVAVMTGTYNFTSRLNLSVRARHYWNQVIYNSFYNVSPEGDHIPRAFVLGQDQNYNVFNLDAFLTWDFRLGSRIIVGWKNWLGDNYGVDGYKYDHYLPNLGQSLTLPHGNELTLRVIYFLDYNQFKAKR